MSPRTVIPSKADTAVCFACMLTGGAWFVSTASRWEDAADGAGAGGAGAGGAGAGGAGAGGAEADGAEARKQKFAAGCAAGEAGAL